MPSMIPQQINVHPHGLSLTKLIPKLHVAYRVVAVVGQIATGGEIAHEGAHCGLDVLKSRAYPPVVALFSGSCC